MKNKYKLLILGIFILFCSVTCALIKHYIFENKNSDKIEVNEDEIINNLRGSELSDIDAPKQENEVAAKTEITVESVPKESTENIKTNESENIKTDEKDNLEQNIEKAQHEISL